MPDGWLYALLGFALFCALMIGMSILIMVRARKGIQKQLEMDIEEMKRQPP